MCNFLFCCCLCDGFNTCPCDGNCTGVDPCLGGNCQFCDSCIICITCGLCSIPVPAPTLEQPKESEEQKPIQVPAIKTQFIQMPPYPQQQYLPCSTTEPMSSPPPLPPPIVTELISIQIPVTAPHGSMLSVQKSTGEMVVFQVPLGTCPGSIIQIQC